MAWNCVLIYAIQFKIVFFIYNQHLLEGFPGVFLDGKVMVTCRTVGGSLKYDLLIVGWYGKVCFV